MTINESIRKLWLELDRAVRADDIAGVRQLVERHCEFLHDIPDLGSCLRLAAKLGRLKIVELLLNMGADVDQVEMPFGGALEAAAGAGQVDVVRCLLARRAKLDVSLPEFNSLFSAIYHGRVEVAKILLAAGINVNAVYRSQSGKLRNALSFAQERDQQAIVEVLQNAGCHLPVEGVDKPIWQPESFATLASEPPNDRQQIIDRIADLYGPPDALALQGIVPIDEHVDIAINVIRPNDRNDHLTLFTTGMSDKKMTVPSGQEAFQFAELIMHLPVNWRIPKKLMKDDKWLWPFVWLRQIAYYPHMSNSWLGGSWTIISSDEPPVPLGPSTKQTCLLLLADFDEWSPIRLEDGKVIHFYTVYPIFTEERDFEKKHGLVPLLERLKTEGHSTVVDVNRASVV